MWQAVARTGTVKTDGAFYFFGALPPAWRTAEHEAAALEVLAEKFRVVVTPGVAFGVPGYFRVSYGSLPDGECVDAAGRLGEGLDYLAANGP